MGDAVPNASGAAAPFDISDDEFAEDIMNQVQETVAPADVAQSTDNSGDQPINDTQYVHSDQVPEFEPGLQQTKIDLTQPITETKSKIDQAMTNAAQSQTPEVVIQDVMAEISEDTSMLTTASKLDQQEFQIQSLQYLCNALIRNAKLASKMTRIVNTDQVTKAVNKTLLMEDLNPVHLSLSQFLQHPLAHSVWTLASNHDSDFVQDNSAWGKWWMTIVQDQNPKLK